MKLKDKYYDQAATEINTLIDTRGGDTTTLTSPTDASVGLVVKGGFSERLARVSMPQCIIDEHDATALIAAFKAIRKHLRGQ
jgi:hypothetical protein